jgi:hypothetical protein
MPKPPEFGNAELTASERVLLFFASPRERIGRRRELPAPRCKKRVVRNFLEPRSLAMNARSSQSKGRAVLSALLSRSGIKLPYSSRGPRRSRRDVDGNLCD